MATPAPSTGGTAPTSQKPLLSGVRIKARKAVKKQTKFDPYQFRNDVLTAVADYNLSSDEESGDETTGRSDLDLEFSRISAGLEASGQKLDYRRYGESLIEMFITGTVLDPGGVLVPLGETPELPCRIFGSPDGSYTDIKKRVEVFNKVIRRYKYLQKIFEDVLVAVVPYLNKWGESQTRNLGVAVGVFMGMGVLPVTVLRALFKDHLVRDGTALTFLTHVFAGYLNEQSVLHLFTNLAKNNALDQRLLDFLPPNKREHTYFVEHFVAQGMNEFVDIYQKRRSNLEKESIVAGMKTLVEEGKDPKEVESYLSEHIAANQFVDKEVVSILWDGIVGSISRTAKADQTEAQIGKLLSTYSKLFAAHCQSARAELSLILKIQTFCYEDSKLLKLFRSIMVSLYKYEVITENALLYWKEKGAAGGPGKQVFLKQMEPFCKWLREAEEEQDED